MAVKITRLELSAAELRRAARRSSDAAAGRRMLALAMVLEGCPRKEAAERAGMNRQTLRDWVHRYNAEGLAGLSDRPHPGPKPRLSAKQMEAFETIVLAGPDPAVDKVVRWRRVDLQAVLKTRFGIEIHERTVGKLLARLELRRLSVRPQHPRVDVAAQEAFKKTSPSW
jgi:transposase